MFSDVLTNAEILVSVFLMPSRFGTTTPNCDINKSNHFYLHRVRQKFTISLHQLKVKF